MKFFTTALIAAVAVFLANCAHAATHYVSLTSANPVAPFTDWSTAATNIQDAIDASTNGDLVLVTNGTYSTGGRLMGTDKTTNRIVLNQAITVQSVNGPTFTVIQGRAPVLDSSAVRCAWLTNNATLSGFTVEWGATTFSPPGVGGGVWCASSSAVVANCIIVTNVADLLGAAMYQGTAENCFICSNTVAQSLGGAAYSSILLNCTVVSNGSHAGISGCFATNSIIYYNGAVNVNGSSVTYCCASPLPTGSGNFTNPPQLFADNIHLLNSSPCIGAGTNIVTGTDIFGQAWSNPPSIGCAEWNPSPFAQIVQLQVSNLSSGFSARGAGAGQPPFSFSWLKDGEPLFDNGHFNYTETSNLMAGGITPGDGGAYQVVVSNAFGMATSAVVSLGVHCVDASGVNPVAPFSTWDTAATNIQDAIDAASAGDAILVTNGVYSTGGVSMDRILTNRITLNKAVTVESVNGPWVTIVQGAGPTNGPSAVRCAWLTNNAALLGFTLEQGATYTAGGPAEATGGGVWCASTNCVVANCVIVSNIAAAFGGGANQGTLFNCLIRNNSSGIYFSYAINCTIVSNLYAGIQPPGAGSGAATNCIVYYNGNDTSIGPFFTYSHCCLPIFPLVNGNFTNAPLFYSDGIHLAAGSPCIGTGTNVSAGADIFGQPWANPPSIGCAEWQPAPLIGTPKLQLGGALLNFAIGTVAVDGQGPFSYSWLLNGTPLETNASFISIETNSLTATSVTLADAGSYQLVVSNAYGSVTSSPVTLTIHCVDANGTNAVPPYLSWASAATNIQDAIDAAAMGDIVIVTNGFYNTGGRSMDGALSNRVTLDKALTVMSVNGYSATTIQGAFGLAKAGSFSVRCAWLTNGAVLAGFTLRDGSGGAGGGAWCSASNAIISNCLLTNNVASEGGGIAFGTINNSLLVFNLANVGQAAYNSTLNQCTIQGGNSILAYQFPSATSQCLVRNSIVVGYYNAFDSPPEVYDYSCTEPLGGFTQMPLGVSNINADVFNPQFLDWYHLEASSPCRAAGNALYSTGTDLDGEPWANPPSMGCSEFVPTSRSGPLAVSISGYETNVVVNDFTSYQAIVSDTAASLSWSYSDGTTITNVGDVTAHTWTNVGNQSVTVTAYNESYPNGVSATLPVIVFPSPITNAPAYVTGYVDGNVTFDTITPIPWWAPPYSLQWYFNGNPLTNGDHYAGTHSGGLTISNLQSSDAGSYYLLASNYDGFGSNLVDVLSVQYITPTITPGEPASAAVYLGRSVSLTATAAGGTAPLSYQWYDGTTALQDTNEYSGSATPVLTINPAGLADSGGYTLVITNAGGSVTSQVANVTVLGLPPPSYVAYDSAGSNYFQTFDSLPYQPTNSVDAANPVNINGVSYSLGNPFDFAFLAETTGSGGLGLLNSMSGWYGLGNAAADFGATAGDQTNGGVLNFGSTNDAISAGNRSLGLVATGATGPTAFGVRFINLTGYALGQFNLSYTSELWRQTATAKIVTNFYYLDLSGTNGFLTNFASDSLTELSFPTGDPAWGTNGPVASNYVSLINQSFTTNWPAGAALWVIWEMSDSGEGGQGIGIDTLDFSAGLATNLAPVITTEPQSESVTNGLAASFSVTVSNLLSGTYEWFTNGVPLFDTNEFSGSTNTTLAINPSMISDATTYWVVISNAYGSATSIPITLTVSAAVMAPGFMVLPQSQTNIVGSAVVFSATPTGTQPIAFQWQFDGTNVSGATDATLELTNLAYSNAGTYTLFLSNSAGTNVSQPAILTVVAAPPVQVNLVPQTGNVVLQWPSAGGTNLLVTPDLTQPWAPAGLPIISSNSMNSVSVPIGAASQFFRLLQ
jgi:hypothetical protein